MKFGLTIEAVTVPADAIEPRKATHVIESLAIDIKVGPFGDRVAERCG